MIRKLVNYSKYRLTKIQRWFQCNIGKYYYTTRRNVSVFDTTIFKDKRVAIIGPADSAFKQELGQYIDSFDLVVRINKGVELIEKYSAFIGKRTDILFHSFNFSSNPKFGSPLTLDLWRSNQLGYLLCSYNVRSKKVFRNQIYEFCYKTKGKFNAFQLDIGNFNNNFDVLKPYSPTNGFSAINTIFNSQPKEIYITGFTFFKTNQIAAYRGGHAETVNEVRNNVGANHEIELEYQYVKRIYNANKGIIILDTTLQKIIDEDN